MKTIFLRRNSSKLLAGLVTVGCLLFVLMLRRYKPDLSSRSYFPGGSAPLLDNELPTCTSFSEDQVLITTPNKVLLYGLITHSERTIHSGHGLYYGSFRGPDNYHDDGTCSPTLFVNTRPQDSDGNDEDKGDKIIQFDVRTQEILRTIPVEFSQFSHDMIKYGNRLFLADTGNGNIHELDYPSFSVRKTFDAFTRSDHINNLGFKDGRLLAMLHSRGESALSVLDTASGDATLYRGVGSQSHQAVQMPGNQILYLDSGHASLKLLKLETMEIYNLYTLPDVTKKFLKGLLVRDNVAYFGSTIAGSRQWRRDPQNDAEIIQFCLKEFKLLSKHQIQSDGLTNMITQPFVSDDTGYVAVNSREVDPPKRFLQRTLSTTAVDKRYQKEKLEQVEKDPLKQILGAPSKTIEKVRIDTEAEKETQKDGDGSEKVEANGGEVVNYRESQKLDYNSIPDIDQENIVGGHWPSGLKFMDLGWKNVKGNLAKKVDRYEDVQLIMGDTGEAYLPLKNRLLQLDSADWEYANQRGNAFLSERDGVMNKFKPGVRDIKFAFSDILAKNSYIFPYFFKYEKELMPILDLVLGRNMTKHIGRMQLARMADEATIRQHVDSGGWPSALHRIHVPIVLSPGTKFFVVGKDDVSRPYLIHLQEGQVFEINNRVPHWVENSLEQRIHLVIDVSEKPYTDQHFLKPGQTCKYLKEIICEEPTVSHQEALAAWNQFLASNPPA